MINFSAIAPIILNMLIIFTRLIDYNMRSQSHIIFYFDANWCILFRFNFPSLKDLQDMVG